MTSRLTRREMQVLLMSLRGATDKEIAHELSIAMTTVRTHIFHLRVKLGAMNRTQLGAQAIEGGLCADMSYPTANFSRDFEDSDLQNLTPTYSDHSPLRVSVSTSN